MRLHRTVYAIVAIVAAIVFVIAMDLVFSLSGSDGLAKTILGKDTAGTRGLPYPLSIQNIMWIMFFVAIAEIIYRRQETRVSRSHLAKQYLPSDKDRTILQAGELTPIFSKVREKITDDAALLPKLIYQTILQFQNSKSIDAAANLVNSQMEYLSHQLDLKYTMLRYLIWLIPTLGFIGTVYGIAIALAGVSVMDPNSPELLKVATSNLAVAFDTTLIALVQSALLVYLMNITQEREERCLNLSGQDCLNNLVNRLYTATGDQI